MRQSAPCSLQLNVHKSVMCTVTSNERYQSTFPTKYMSIAYVSFYFDAAHVNCVRFYMFHMQALALVLATASALHLWQQQHDAHASNYTPTANAHSIDSIVTLLRRCSERSPRWMNLTCRSHVQDICWYLAGAKSPVELCALVQQPSNRAFLAQAAGYSSARTATPAGIAVG